MAGDTTLMLFNIFQQNSNIGIFYKVDTLLAHGDTSAAFSLLDNVSANNIVDINYLYYYGLIMNLQKGVGLQPQDTAYILWLAESCPSKFGMVVYSARNLYNQVTGGTKVFTDKCPTIASRKAKPNPKTLQSSPAISILKELVYPNPTDGLINIRIPEKGTWQIALYNQSGKAEWTKLVDNQIQELQYRITGNKGFYLLKLTNLETSKSLTNKIIYK